MMKKKAMKRIQLFALLMALNGLATQAQTEQMEYRPLA